jgi:hypothetical protein
MGEQGHQELVDCARPNAGEPMPWLLAGHACQVFLFKNVPHGALGTLCWGPQLWVYWVIIHAPGRYCKALPRGLGVPDCVPGSGLALQRDT